LDRNRNIGSYDLKAMGVRNTLILRKMETRNILLVIFIEDHEVFKSESSISLNCSSDQTVKQVIEQITNTLKVPVGSEDDNFALFIPTKKSKKGIFMEKSKTLQSFGFQNQVNRFY
jgi:hypothetical protein